jgi:hypothetical protein
VEDELALPLLDDELALRFLDDDELLRKISNNKEYIVGTLMMMTGKLL